MADDVKCAKLMGEVSLALGVDLGDGAAHRNPPSFWILQEWTLFVGVRRAFSSSQPAAAICWKTWAHAKQMESQVKGQEA